MCGLSLVIDLSSSSSPSAESESESSHLNDEIQRRGPDSSSVSTLKRSPQRVVLKCSVLHLRGDKVTCQPFQFTDTLQGSLLAFNGELFNSTRTGDDEEKEEDEEGPLKVSEGENDGQVLTSALQRALETLEHSSAITLKAQNYAFKVQTVLMRCEGPFACLFYCKPVETLFFARDRLGRRSLLWSRCEKTRKIIISSVALHDEKEEKGEKTVWQECSTSGMYALDSETLSVRFYYWPYMVEQGCPLSIELGSIVDGSAFLTPITTVSVILPFQRAESSAAIRCLKAGQSNVSRTEFETSLRKISLFSLSHKLSLRTSQEGFLHYLRESVRKRVINIPRYSTSSTEDASLAVMFSGGVDCTLLARIAHDYVEEDRIIDLVSVSFVGHLNPMHATTTRAVPDRVTAINGYLELQSTCPNRTWRLIEVNVSAYDVENAKMTLIQLCLPQRSSMDFNLAAVIYFAARAEGIVRRGAGSWTNEIDSFFARYNQSQCNVDQVSAEPQNESAHLEENHEKIQHIQQLHISRKTKSKTRSHKKSRLPSPKDAYVDTALSIDCFLPLADIDCPSNQLLPEGVQRYRSKAKVMLSGLGADELFAGYSRHWTSMGISKREASPSFGDLAAIANLSAELDKDFHRLWIRNLGRDDRVVSHHSREVRHPFLDEGLISWWRTQPLSSLCDVKQISRGHSDKRIVRDAACYLGLKQTSTLEKRAAQFGSRFANRRHKGEVVMTEETDVETVCNPNFLHPLRPSRH